MAANINLEALNNINSAKERYFRAYENQFQGRLEDYVRLRNHAEEKFKHLKAKAPVFYHTKLYTLVNQAATKLLLNKSNVDANHRIFLMILDSLIGSQPNGVVDFETEKKHHEAVDKLQKQQKDLRAQEQRLAAAENDYDDMDNDSESHYVLHESIQRKLLKVSKALAKLHNLRAEEKPFLLVPKPGLGLSRLQNSRRDLFDRIDQGIKDILSKRTKGRIRRELPDRGLIKDMLMEILNLKVNPDDIKQILEETYGDLRNYFRNLDTSHIDEQHQYYTTSNYLMPKEGDILSDPDNIPPEVVYKLNKSLTMGEEKMIQVLDTFARKRRTLDEDGEPLSNKMTILESGPVRVPNINSREIPDVGDDCDDDQDDEGDEDEESEDDEDDSDVELLDIGYTNEELRSLVRVKEERAESPSSVKSINLSDIHQTVQTTDREPDLPDPFAELDNLLTQQEALTYNIDSPELNNIREEDENGDNNNDCDNCTDDDDDVEVLQCLDREDKIQMVDLIDDE